jgi:hypothetical protein
MPFHRAASKRISFFANVSGRWNESEKLNKLWHCVLSEDVNNECCVLFVWYANSIHKKSLTQLTKIFFITSHMHEYPSIILSIAGRKKNFFS